MGHKRRRSAAAAASGIEFIGSADNNGTSNFSIDISGIDIQAGDYIIVAVGSPETFDAISGYTSLVNINASDSTNTYLRVARKIAAGSETSISITGIGDDSTGLAAVFRGVDNTTPEDVTTTTATGANSGEPNPPSITPTTTGAFVLCAGASATGTTGGTLTQAGDLDYFETFSVQGGVPDVDAAFGYLEWTSGAFNAGAWNNTQDNSFRAWCAASVALRPA